MGKSSKAKEKVEMVKTTLRLPEPLWRDARIRALDERKDFQTVVAEALGAHLKTKPKSVKKGVK